MNADAHRGKLPTGRRFGSPVGWSLAGFMTLASLFLYSGAMGHSHIPPAHPVVGNLGWILAGLSPFLAYVAFEIAVGRSRSTWIILVSLLVAALILFLFQILGMSMLRYALPGQTLILG